MPELGSYGSVRGARGNSRPYRESHCGRVKTTRPTTDIEPDQRLSLGASSSFFFSAAQYSASDGSLSKSGLYLFVSYFERGTGMVVAVPQSTCTHASSPRNNPTGISFCSLLCISIPQLGLAIGGG